LTRICLMVTDYKISLRRINKFATIFK